jgi:hypothetical protein
LNKLFFAFKLNTNRKKNKPSNLTEMSDLIEKNKQNTFVNKVKQKPAGLAGLLGLGSVVAYAVYHYKKKPADMKPSVYM